MNLRQVQAFATVAELMNFTRAAEALGYAQSTVTDQIRALEESLGRPLFERQARRVTLSEAGRRFQPYAARLLSLALEATEAVQEEDACQGILRMGAAETLCVFRLPPILRRYRMRFPKVQAQLQVGGCLQLRDALRHGMLDVALLLDVAKEDPDLIVHALVQEPVSIVAYPWLPLVGAGPVAPADLEGIALIHTEPESSYRIQFEAILAAAGVRTGAVTEFNSIEAIKQCVMAGLGIAVLPSVTCAAEFERGVLVELDWAGPPITVSTQLVYHRTKRISPAVAAFIEIARQQLVRPL